ncbi:DUF4747 family protein [Billgrantia saliphila]|uniref:DUF4747 family protein n=1 Tax=Billgrantia saliphila TaxID=1848458 RepID=UPI000D0A9DAE|nr:DUF4747 family protein [Halomonas saliphila]
MRFSYYNVQATPLDYAKHGNIGSSGYRDVCLRLKEHLDYVWEDGGQVTEAALVSRGIFHVLKQVKVEKNYASGYLIKFNLIEEVVQPFTLKPLYSAHGPASSDYEAFFFVYSFENHVLAIEDKKKLPSPSVLKKIFHHFFGPCVDEKFPNHVVDASMLNDYSAIEELEGKADGYYRAEIKASFTNSFEFVREELVEKDKEYRDKGISESTVVEKAKKGGVMAALSKSAQILLMLSLPTGHASISYRDAETGKREGFHTDNRPIILEVEEYEEDSGEYKAPKDFERDVLNSIITAKNNSTKSKENDEGNEKKAKEYMTPGEGDE